jgi:hypothetical protein
MFDYPTIERVNTSPTANASQPLPERPRLSMIWAIDPETAKPVARWVAEKANSPITMLAAAA